MVTRRKSRELALKILFEWEVGKANIYEVYKRTTGNFNDKNIEGFISRIIENIQNHKGEIDSIIQRHAIDWKIQRMGNIDRNILRIAICEMYYMPDIPSGVSINEAIELGKKYGDENSYRFINGILGSVNRSLTRHIVD